MASTASGASLVGIVDMGSNGIRFSISDIAEPTARILPTVFQDRAAISLYDAQYPKGISEKQPIDQLTIRSVIAAFRRFKTVCADFDVPDGNVRVLATEATRNATNSEAFRAAIKGATGWNVTLLAKEEEGRIGAMGVASSFHKPCGLVMDLGGGSVQLSWMGSTTSGDVRIESSVSLPYGAAALLRRIDEATRQSTPHSRRERAYDSDALRKLRKDLLEEMQETIAKLKIPSYHGEGIELYLSGGGFRGWGYALMDSHRVSPYPIPIINGFSVKSEEFMDHESIALHVTGDCADRPIFRISDRRASQIPAVSLLVSTLSTALPTIKRVRFAQGGVREGSLYSQLPPTIRTQHPLRVATLSMANPSAPALLSVLQDAIPATSKPSLDTCPSLVFEHVLPAFANALYVHAGLTPDTRAAVALRCTTTGVPLAAAHGLQHEQRAALALMLCERWGGELAPTDRDFKERLEGLLSVQSRWWLLYAARVGALVGEVYPAGRVTQDDDGAAGIGGGVDLKERKRLSLEAKFVGADADATTAAKIRLDVSFGGGRSSSSSSSSGSGSAGAKALKKIEAIGKKKRWIGGKKGFGLKVQVEVDDGNGEDDNINDDDDDRNEDRSDDSE